MTNFWTSDWHLGHRRIIELSQRPFRDIDHMHTELVDRTNEVVGEDDTLNMLGDMFMGNFDESVAVLSRLRTTDIVLYPGNHDKWADAYKNTVAKRERVRAQLLELGWTVHEDRRPSSWELVLDGDLEVNVSHYPYVGDSHERDRFQELRPLDDGRPLVHGHVHELWAENGRMVNVGVDVRDFRPISEPDLAAIVRGL